MPLSAPCPLTITHQRDDFECGITSLNDWRKKRAYQNQINHASRTYVVTEGSKVVGYYCLASGALDLRDAPSSLRRNTPDPIPMAILGRLAVDHRWWNQKLGAALLQDAVLRTLQARDILGMRGVLVHAISEQAKAFYEHHGFIASPQQPMTLIMSLKENTQ